jgi:hypothetical protein
VAGVPVLDLRLICNQASDYANEIEPSVLGGEKITEAILKLIAEHDFAKRRRKCLGNSEYGLVGAGAVSTTLR